MSTRSERVDTLLRQSDEIHDTIDPYFDGERRYRRMLRVGVNLAAISLRQGLSTSETGTKLLRIPHNNPPTLGPLDEFANLYADVERATLDREGNPETDARHALHLMKLGPLYARDHYPSLDPGKIALYALLHDSIEAFAKDVSSLGITPEQAQLKHRNEMLALEKIRATYGEAWPEFVAVIDDYENLKEAEARFNKSLDKIVPGVNHFTDSGAQLKSRYGFTRDTFLEAMDEGTERMRPYAEAFPLIIEDRTEVSYRIADLVYPKAA